MINTPTPNSVTTKSLHLVISLLMLICCVAPLPAQDLYDEATVRDIELTFSQPNWWNDLYTAMQAESYLAADMVVDGVSFPSVGVRFKGNSSYYHPGIKKLTLKVQGYLELPSGS